MSFEFRKRLAMILDDFRRQAELLAADQPDENTFLNALARKLERSLEGFIKRVL